MMEGIEAQEAISAVSASSATENSTPTPHTPVQLIACGYRYWTSPKTKNRFPLWCIQVSQKSSEKLLVWKSKADFLRMARESQCAFPKASFANLVREDPWKTIDALPDIEEGAGINHWHIRMTKHQNIFNTFLKKIWKQNPDLIMLDLPPTQQLSTVSSTCWSSSHQWGQYFCSPRNAQQLVQVLFHRMHELGPSTWNVIEPSCGHGDVISAFVNEYNGEDLTISRMDAYDIDPTAIQICKAKQSGYPISIFYHSRDFLKSSFAETASNDHKVAVIGGPPYYSKHHQHDLPFLFVQHSIQHHHADLVVFLMPQRCSKQICANTMSSIPSNILSTHRVESLELVDGSTFYFHGQPVSQPSIIQVFQRM